MATQLNGLNAFVAVGRALSFSGAARATGVSTSALSQAVRGLEQSLGLALLKRSSRQVALTEAGRQLLDRAGPALDEALAALTAAAQPRAELSGPLKLTVPTSAVPLVAPILSELCARHPAIALDVTVEDRFAATIAEGFDAGVRLTESIDQDMVHLPIGPPTRVVVVAAPSYLRRMGAPKTPEALSKHACIGRRFSPEAPPWVWEFERGAKSWKIPVTGPLVTNDPGLARQLALSGAGLLFALELSVAEALKAGLLKPVLQAYCPEVPPFCLYYPGRKQASPPLAALIAVVKERRAGS